MAGNCSHSITRDSYQGVAQSVQFPSRQMEPVFSDATLSHLPLPVIPFSKLCSSVFHLVFLCIERSRQSIWIALAQQCECQLAEQTSRTKSQDRTISCTQSDAMLRPHLFDQPAISIIRLLGIESERGHSCVSFLFDLYPSIKTLLPLNII